MNAIPAFVSGLAPGRADPPASPGGRQGGGGGFAAAMDSTARKPDRQPAQSDAGADDAEKAGRPARPDHQWPTGAGKTDESEATLADAAAKDAASAEAAAASAPLKADAGKAGDKDAPKADPKAEKDGKEHSTAESHAGAAAIPLVPVPPAAAMHDLKKGQAPAAISGEAAGGGASAAKAAAETAAAAARAAAAATAKPGGASAASNAAAAKVEVVSVEATAGQGGATSALASLRNRLSAADAAAGNASGEKAETRPAAGSGAPQATKRGQPASAHNEPQPAPSRGDSKGSQQDGHTMAATISAGPQVSSATGGTAAPAAPALSNGAALANAIVSRPDWAQALSQHGSSVGATQAGQVSALRLQLSPADLGMVTATLRVSGNQLVISLQVQTAEAYRQLSTGNGAILDKLKGHGYAVENITVQHVAVNGSAGSQQAQQQQQQGFPSQQGGQNAAAGGGRFGGQGQGHGQHGGRPAPFSDHPAPLPGEALGNAGTGGRRTGGVWL